MSRFAQLVSFALLMIAVAPLEGLAGSHSISVRSARRHVSAARSMYSRENNGSSDDCSDSEPGESRYRLEDLHQGESFFEGWDYFSYSDPTHGMVNYQSREDAVAKNLSYVQADGTAVLAVDDFTDLQVGQKRDSVRIQSKKTYNGGLFIADFSNMPHGCSVWPAWWSVGPNWPNGGEIDIFEGVHDQDVNQYTIHTGPGCTLSTNGLKLANDPFSKKCTSSPGDNSGCGFHDTDTRSYGRPFNMVGGGVYAHLWSSEGIKIWHFPRGEIPVDIETKAPNPDAWGPPAAFWSTNTCTMSDHFYEHRLVLGTTLCGDWAGPTYRNAGCPGTCEDAVANKDIYQWAKWKVNYIAVYQLDI